jgi:hypothetical protein
MLLAIKTEAPPKSGAFLTTGFTDFKKIAQIVS